MPIVLAMVAVIVGAYFWFNRARRTTEIAGELASMAQDVVGAARAYGFRRRANIHPVESVDDAGLATAGLAYAFMELGRLPSAEQQRGLISSLAKRQGVTLDKAEEMAILGRWLTNECGGAQPAIARLARRLYKLGGPEVLEGALATLDDVARSGPADAALSDQQRDALDEIRRAFRIT
ncbi:MAG: hypothetical protein ACRCSU_08870 [Paracoccaceae bacterium]